RDFTYPNGATENQLTALRRVGYLAASMDTDPNLQRALAPLSDADVSAEYRVHSYLTVNCAPCHKFGRAGTFDPRLTYSMPITRIVDGLLLQGTNTDMRVVAHGSLERSMLWKRMTS